MKIGIDLRPLQTGHRFRGVGEVVKQTVNRILELAAKDDKHDVSFVFFEYSDASDPKKLIQIPKKVDFESKKVGKIPEEDKTSTKKDKLQRNFKELYGEPVQGSEDCDVFLQYDFAMGVPTNTRSVLLKHDLIPFIFWDQFFTSPKVHIKNKAARTTLRTAFHNYKTKRILKRSLSNAQAILTVSENTKKDLNKHFGVNHDKMKVAFLGVSVKPAKTQGAGKNKDMPSKPYLLFLGGIDAKRRAVDDIVAAFNNLKAKGHDIQLVLAGENFQSKEDIPHEVVRNSILNSSYEDDILTLGYIDDAIKQKLFNEAIAFVYPTNYEGFGIPVLEAMLMSCPVITYKNSSIPEVGGKHALYAENWTGIKKQAEKLLKMNKPELDKLKKEAKTHAEQFTWDKTAKVIYNELVEGNS